MLSIKEINLLQAQNEGLKKQNAELQKENAKLKEEIEIRDNLSEKFRKEALSWANIANEYQKDRTKLEQTLQEIKAIAEADVHIVGDEKFYYDVVEQILQKIAESEG